MTCYNFAGPAVSPFYRDLDGASPDHIFADCPATSLPLRYDSPIYPDDDPHGDVCITCKLRWRREHRRLDAKVLADWLNRRAVEFSASQPQLFNISGNGGLARLMGARLAGLDTDQKIETYVRWRRSLTRVREAATRGGSVTFGIADEIVVGLGSHLASVYGSELVALVPSSNPGVAR